MPFTLSHAAAALPLQWMLRGRAVLALLVIGSFIPDLPYFLPEPLAGINAHRLPGLVFFGIPCGWLLYALWRHVLLAPIASLLAHDAAALLLLASASDPARPVRAGNGTLCLLLGAFSHVVWDAFTHQRGLVVHLWPTLAQPLLHVGGMALPSYSFSSTAARWRDFWRCGFSCDAGCATPREVPSPRTPRRRSARAHGANCSRC